MLIGCGARTESFLDEEGAGAQTNGGATNGGAAAHGGATNGGAAAHGGAGFGGSVSGAPGTGAVSGFPSGGTGAVSGFGGGSTSGASGVGGFPFGGFGAVSGFGATGGVGGDAGAAGTGGIVDACVSLANTSCDKCLCSVCASNIVGCFSDLGCTLIFACVQQTGCQGFGCYSPNTCRPIIDKFGGLNGNSMQQVFSLLSCSFSSQNTCNCN